MSAPEARRQELRRITAEAAEQAAQNAARVAARTVEKMLYAWGWGAEVCPMCWGSHGCDLPRGHAGAHVCGNIWVIDGELSDQRCSVHDGEHWFHVMDTREDGTMALVQAPVALELFDPWEQADAQAQEAEVKWVTWEDHAQQRET